MKRPSVDTHKRSTSTAVDNGRPRGPLTDEELAAVRRAYADGCRGEVIIGMRREERLLTMLVPDTDAAKAESHTLAVNAKLLRIGCNRVCRLRQS